MFSLCLRGKQFTCFPGKHKLYMFSNPVFLEYRDHPQQCMYTRLFLSQRYTQNSVPPRSHPEACVLFLFVLRTLAQPSNILSNLRSCLEPERSNTHLTHLRAPVFCLFWARPAQCERINVSLAGIY